MPKKKVNERQATIDVTRTLLGKQKTKNTKIAVRPFVTDVAMVSVKYGATIPTGDYQSARVDIMISVPCYVEEIVDVYKDTRSLVDKIIDKEVSRLTGED